MRAHVWAYGVDFNGAHTPHISLFAKHSSSYSFRWHLGIPKQSKLPSGLNPILFSLCVCVLFYPTWLQYVSLAANTILQFIVCTSTMTLLFCAHVWAIALISHWSVHGSIFSGSYSGWMISFLSLLFDFPANNKRLKAFLSVVVRKFVFNTNIEREREKNHI